MKISYNWLKSYIPEIPQPEKLADVFTYHLCEVESLEKLGTSGVDEDTIFDINILPIARMIYFPIKASLVSLLHF